MTELRGPIISNSDHEDLGPDDRKRRTDEELVAELRNKLVIDILEAHKGKQEAPADIEPVEILPEQPNHANHDAATEKNCEGPS